MTDETVFTDDFSDYAPGPIPYDYSPWGEYHCKPHIGKLGRWREVTTHYSWKTSSGNWRVLRDGARPVLEQTFRTDTSYPMFIAEVPRVRRGEVAVDVRLISTAAPAGLVFGYRHSRDFYTFTVDGARADLRSRRHEVVELLASAEVELDPDAWTRLSVQWDDDGVRALLDGEEALRCEATPPVGHTGLIAKAPARFADFRLHGVAAVATGSEPVRNEAQPRPRLWKEIDLSGFGSDRNIRVGDINGDGQNELIIAQRQRYLGSGDYCHITCLTALDLSGRRLWQIGEPSPQGQTTADLCFQVHDLDGDGRCEVIYTRDFRLVVADGATGRGIRSVPTPRTESGERNPGGWPLHRTIGDSLYFADLRGTGRADTVVLKDRYDNCWVYDDKLDLLWHHACKTGHYPVSWDVDGDGREELLMGYTLLDGDGRVLWELETFDHADSAVIGEFGPPGSGLRVALAASDAGFYMLDAEGEVLKHHPMGHAQTVSVAKLRPDVEGLQIVVNTYWGAPGITSIMDHGGKVLREFEPMHYASLLNPVNWPTDGTELLLLSTDPEEGGLMDGYGERAVTFPDDGHPVLCCDARDVDGDGVDEILTWNHDSLWLYKPDPLPERGPDEYPRRNPSYNDSNYRGQYSFPRSWTAGSD